MDSTYLDSQLLRAVLGWLDNIDICDHICKKGSSTYNNFPTLQFITSYRKSYYIKIYSVVRKRTKVVCAKLWASKLETIFHKSSHSVIYAILKTIFRDMVGLSNLWTICGPKKFEVPLLWQAVYKIYKLCTAEYIYQLILVY